MSAPKEAERRAAEAEEEALDEAADSDSSIESLVARADVDGLLDLAKAYRVGADGHARDLAACFRCYDEAAKLGSVQAEYSAALFHLSGGIVEKWIRSSPRRAFAPQPDGRLHAGEGVSRQPLRARHPLQGRSGEGRRLVSQRGALVGDQRRSGHARVRARWPRSAAFAIASTSPTTRA